MLEIFWFDLIKYLIPFLTLIFLISYISKPLTNIFFDRNIDKGFIHGQAIGFLGISWISFVLGTLLTSFGINKFINLNIVTVSLAFIIWVIINLYLAFKFNYINILTSFKEISKSFKYFSLTIFLTLFFYFINSLNVIYNPTGAEIHMNIGIINSVLESNQLPIKDFWLAGNHLNYYYFSQYSLSLYTQAFNLNPRDDFYFIGTIYLILFSASLLIFVLSLVNNLLGFTNKFQILLVLSITFSFTFLTSPLISIFPIQQMLTGNKSFNEIFLNYSNYSVRAIENVIAETFNYSFLINPIHPVSNSLVIGVLFFNLLYFYRLGREEFNIKNKKLIFLFTLIGFAGLINTWDVLIYLGTILGFLLLDKYSSILKNPKNYLVTLILLMYPIITIMSPWFISFESPAGVPNLVREVSNLLELFNFWGIYLILAIALFLYQKNLNDKSKFVVILTVFSLLVILLLEILYFRDALDGTKYFRANTYYKFSNLVILIFSITLSTFLSLFIIQSRKVFIKIYLILMIIATFWFNFIFLKTRAVNYEIKYSGIISQDYVVESYSPELLKLINLLEEIKNEKDIIWEGSGGPYTYTNFVSIFTGIPTVAGWANHEYTWRKNARQIELLDEKYTDTEEFFTGKDIEKKKELLKKNRVTYVVLGKSEREIYQEKLQSEIISQLGEVVYEENDTKLIKIIQ